MKKCLLLAFAVALTAAAATKASDAVDTLTPLKDNTLYENGTGAISNGAGQHLFAGQTSLSSSLRRAVLAFDVASAIPANATIDSVKLVVNMSKTISAAETVTIHRLSADWGEGSSDALGEEGGGTTAATGDATWLHTFFSSSFWTTAGGDFDPTASASAAVAGIGQYTWQSAQLAVDVADMLANPGTNFGWILIGNEAATATAKRFDSKEHPTATNRPRLIVYSTVPQPTLFAFQLDEAQAAACAGTGSVARGYCLAILSADSTELSMYVVHDVVSPSAAHIHSGAPCVSGGIQFPFTSPASPIQESFSVTPSDLVSLFNGELYVNVHSGSFPSGEIRGQIVPQPLQFAFTLDEAQAAAGSGTGSLNSGWAVAELDAGVTQLSLTAVHDIPSDSVTDAHIHLGDRGVGGGVIFPTTSATSPIVEQFAIDTNQVKTLLAEGYYLNIHSSAFPAGEIRGQVAREEIVWANQLNEAEANAGVGTGSSATGFIVARLNKDHTRLDIHVEHDVAGVTDGHLHLGAPGVSGPIQFGFTSAASPVVETWSLGNTDLANLLAGDLYVNIHSSSFPSGEIRAQLELETASYTFGLDEASADACNGTGSVATGTATMRLKAGGRQMTIETTHDVSGTTAAHIHIAPECVSGPIVFDLGSGVSPIRDVWYLGDADVIDLWQEELYINVHSATFSSGEIRGQIRNAPVGCCVGDRGDINGDSINADPIDLSFFVDFLFTGGVSPACSEEADINGDGTPGDPIDLSFFVDFLFAGGAVPAPCP